MTFVLKAGDLYTFPKGRELVKVNKNMLSSAPVYAQLPIVDVERARKFYRDSLGLRLIDENEKLGALVFEAGNGTRVELFQSDPPKSGDTAASFKVQNLEEEMKTLRAKGVKFEEYDTEFIKTVNGVCTIDNESCSWFKDSEGNILCLNQRSK